MSNKQIKKYISFLIVIILIELIVVSNLFVYYRRTQYETVIEEEKIEEYVPLKYSEQEHKEVINLTTDFDKSLDDGSGAYDDPNIDPQGNLLVPFDQAYPDLFESGAVHYDEKTLLIKVSNNKNADEVLKAVGIEKTEELFKVSSGTWYEAYVKENSDICKIMEKVRSLDDVLEAEYNFFWEVSDTIIESETDIDIDGLNDNEQINEQWYLRSCGIQRSWQYQIDNELPLAGAGTTVAVIDTGVDYDHDDLYANMWANQNEIPDNGIDDDGNGYIDDYYGVDIVNGQGNAKDDNGHGTHVAGIIAGANNKTGIVGVAYNSKIMAIKAGSASGYFLQSDIAKAIIYAYSNGADVINMSFGGSASTIAVQDALEFAYGDCILVASAGNNSAINEGILGYYGQVVPVYPASFAYVLGVMSVDSEGRESYFSNFDGIAASKVEYEVYAPGSEVLSTIPNNKYGVWSGTSMAAPVVSAMAAMIRADFNDRSLYPTKYIYGQISSTGNIQALCYDSKTHGSHNIPLIANAYDALTKIPSPEVQIRDYTLFDSQEISDQNNGDGVIDSGETIALGFEIWNRWGMAKDATVTISAYSDGGIPNPYVTFATKAEGEYDYSASVNYGDVGTYSVQDAGKVYDGDQWIGWEHPIYVKIDENCPNDMLIDIRVDVSCRNALDINDEQDYGTVSYITLSVRKGYILPSVISEDMRWTADNYYILNNSVFIQEGVTVNVEPGTQIQFWSNDPEDAYAQSSIVYLRVNGTINFNGTKDDYIQIFPSELMNRYEVSIYGNGKINMSYCHVTNAVIDAEKIEHCHFDQNFKDTLWYRYLNSGTVANGSGYTVSINASNPIDESSFYKLGGEGNWVNANICSCKNCVFVDSGINFCGVYENCLFYGNNNYLGSDYGGVSSYTAIESSVRMNVDNISYDLLTGNTYATLYFYDSLTVPIRVKDIKNIVEGYFGGKILSVNNNDYSNDEMAVTSPVSVCIEGEVYILSIDLTDKVIDIDVEELYQITAIPYPMSDEKLIYESMDPDIAAVDENGLVTPLSEGSTDIYVYSADRVASNHLTVNVTDPVPLESISLTISQEELSVGESCFALYTLSPENTTKRQVSFYSSNEEIATVDNSGKITAVSPGTVTISVVSNSNQEIIASADLIVIKNISSILFGDKIFFTTLDKDDNQEFYPEIMPLDYTERVIWESSNPEVAYVDEEGKLIKSKLGTAFLKATASHSKYNGEIMVIISDYDFSARVVKTEEMMRTDIVMGENDPIPYTVHDYTLYALTDNGDIWKWGGDIGAPKKIECNHFVTDFAVVLPSEMHILDDQGVVYRLTDANGVIQIDEEFTDVRKIYSDGGEYGSPVFAIRNDGTVWCWGGNNWSGIYGNGTFTSSEVPVKSNIEDVVDLSVNQNIGAIFLKEDGSLYASGGIDSYQDNPVLIQEGVTSLQHDMSVIYHEFNDTYSLDINYEYETVLRYFTEDGVFSIDKYNNVSRETDRIGDKQLYFSANENFYLENGKVYQSKNGLAEEIGSFEDAVDIFCDGSSLFIQTENNGFFGFGDNSDGKLANVLSSDPSVPNLVLFGLRSNYDELLVEKTNITEGKLNDQYLEIDFNDKIFRRDWNLQMSLLDDYSHSYSFETEMSLDKLRILFTGQMTIGRNYTVSIPEGYFKTRLGDLTNDMTDVSFIYNFGNESQSSSEAISDESLHDMDDLMEFNEEIASATGTQISDANGRFYWTQEEFQAKFSDYKKHGKNPRFSNNAIINRLINNDVEKYWMRVLAPELSNEYSELSLSYNYWGTDNETLIDKQIIDFNDYASYKNINPDPWLKEAPTKAWPFVVNAGVMNSEREAVDLVGNESVTFFVEFNRPMDTDEELDFRFGSTYPYEDYQILGEWVSDTRWEGNATINTRIESGIQYMTIQNAYSGDEEHLKFFKDWGRFTFRIDMSTALSMTMHGEATDTGINLTWIQDDFETLVGYNVYRSDKEDGFYTRLNSTIIPVGEEEFFDATVEPGMIYYYNFTVVQSDLSESTPSGKIVIRSKDTMAPNIYHSPVHTAYTGSNLVISASVIDNVEVQRVQLHYRTSGSQNWIVLDMSKNNDRYYGMIPSSDVTSDGIEYYIDAYDGVSYDYSGTPARPHVITVKESIGNDALGDVDGDGSITNKDALMIIQAVNDLLNLDEDQFFRADINKDGELSSAEALIILKYVSGKITSILV